MNEYEESLQRIAASGVAVVRAEENNAMSNLEEFTKLVDHHDLTYEYSDAGAVWRAGCAQKDAIRALAKELPREDVERIWNAKVDRSMREGYREPFYWRWSPNPTK